MENKEVVLDSGSKIQMTMPDFKTASSLFRAIMKAQKYSSMSKEQLAMDAAFSVFSSEEVEEKLFDCFGRVTYDSMKITRELFDDHKIGRKIREDYIPICSHVIEFVIQPFLAKASSRLEIH